jgi:hypothetical protein
MATLTNKTIASSYPQLLSLPDGGGNETTLVAITDGDGVNTFALQLATDKVYVNGSLGIGVTDPATPLEIAGSGAEAELIYLTSTQSANTSNRVRLSHRLLTDSQERTSFSLLSGFNTITDGSRNSIVEFKTSNAGTFGTAMTINGGNVGIGTSSPSVMLNLESATSTAITAENTGNSAVTLNLDANRSGADQGLGNINFKWNGTAVAQISGASGADTTNKDDGQIQFSTMSGGSSSVNMTLDKDGKLGVGTTAVKNILHVSDGSTSGTVDQANGILITHSTNGRLMFEDSGEGANDKLMMLNHYDESLKIQSINDAQDSYEDFNIATFTRDGHVGFGTLTPNHSKVEIIGDSDEFQLVMSDVADNDDTTKEVRIGMLHYKQAEEPVTLMYAQSGSSLNSIFIGGGTGVGNHATSVNIATASTYNSTSTTTNMVIDNNSRISLSNNDSGGSTGTNSTTGNSIFGYNSGNSIQSGGVNNSFYGHGSGTSVTTGDANVFLGDSTGSSVSTGSFNTYIGKNADGAGTRSNSSALGYNTVAQSDNSVTLGNADVTDVYMSQDSQAYVHSQNSLNHVANSMSSPYYKFNGTGNAISVGDASSTMGKIYSASVFFYIEDAIVADTQGGNGALFTGSGADDDMLFIGSHTGNIAQEIILVGSSTNATVYQASSLSAGHHHIAISWDGTQYDIYLDGTQVTTANIGTPALLDSDDLIIGNGDDDSDGYGSFNGQIHSLSLWNKSLTATEIKELYSGMAVPFKYKGANQTNLITGWTNSGAYGFANFGSSGADLTQFDGDGTLAYAYTNTVPFVVGAKYRLTVVLDNTSGSLPNLMIAEVNGANSISGTDGSFNFAGTELADGTNTFEFTATSAFTTSKRVVLQENATSVNNSATFELVRIGAVAEYDGSGIASDKWFDKSGNDLHGTVSGATVENAPSDSSGLVYEEGTWTPAFSTSGHAPSSITVTRAVYTRIGDVVTLEGNIGFDDSGGGGDPFTLENVPFNFATNSFPTGVANFRFTAFSESTMIYALGNAGSNQLTFYYNDGNGDRAFVSYTNTDVGSNTLTFTITYIV